MITEARVRAALPADGFLRDYVDYAGACTDAPLLYHVAGGFSLLAQAAPSGLCVDLGDEVFTNCFFLVVGPSTRSRKSVSIRLARRILLEAIGDQVGEVPGSPEALVDGMRLKATQILFYEEFGQFLAETDDNYRTPIKTVLNSLWDCSEIGRALVKSRKGSLVAPRLSILGGCAEGYLERHTERVDWEAGFLARWVCFAAERERYYRTPKPNPVMRRDLALRLKMMKENTTLTAFRGFDQAGEAMWAAWLAKCERLADQQDSLGAAAVHRAPPNALKMATLLKMDRAGLTPGGWFLTPMELEPALAFADFHIESVAAVVAQLASSRDMEDRRKVLRAVDPTPTQLGVITRRAKMLKKNVYPVLETLITEGEIIPAPHVEGQGPAYILTSPDELQRRAIAARGVAAAQAQADQTTNGGGAHLAPTPPRKSIFSQQPAPAFDVDDDVFESQMDDW